MSIKAHVCLYKMHIEKLIGIRNVSRHVCLDIMLVVGEDASMNAQGQDGNVCIVKRCRFEWLGNPVKPGKTQYNPVKPSKTR